jgi:hypothetical protein
MKNFFLFSTILIAFSCNKPTPTPVVTTPTYIGTFIGYDSLQTFINGVLNNTIKTNRSFNITANTTIGRNAMMRNFITDSIEANFSNNTIALFPTFQPISNFSGTYDATNLNTYWEFNAGSGIIQKTYGIFKKQ